MPVESRRGHQLSPGAEVMENCEQSDMGAVDLN